MQKIITSISIIKAPEGDKCSYTFSEIDTTGNLIRSNVRESFIIVDNDLKAIATQLEEKVKALTINFKK